MQAVLAGGEEQSRLAGLDFQQFNLQNAAELERANFANTAQNQQFGQNQAGATFGNAALMNRATFQDTQRERQLQEMLALRNQPINEISALMAGGQVAMPQFTPYRPGQVEAAPVGQYAYNSAGINQANYNTQMNQRASTMGGLYGLGSAVLGAAGRMICDRRLKRDVAQVGWRGGLPLSSSAIAATRWRASASWRTRWSGCGQRWSARSPA